MLIKNYIIFLHLSIGFLFALVIVVAIIKDKQRLAKNLILSKDLKKSKQIKVYSHLLSLTALFIIVLFIWISVDSVLDLLKKDYSYETKRLYSISRKSYFHISYDMDFEGSHLDLSVFYNNDFEIKPGKKYGYYYGKRTKLIVGIKEIN